MENKIDQFFKYKLEEHSLPPSEDGWAKVEVNLSKKNNVAVWRIAAAVLIMCALVSAIIWSRREYKNNEQILATKQSPLPRFVSPQTESKSVQKADVSQVEKKSNSSSTRSGASPIVPKSELSQKRNEREPWSVRTQTMVVQTENKSDQKEKQKTEMWSVKTQTKDVEPAFAETSTVKKTSEGNEKINTKATQPTTIASTKQKPIKLEFTLDEFSDEQPVATVNDEKNTGLKKVWVMAIEVKNGDGPVHEIKNELFAINFKKNKNQAKQKD